MFVFTLDLIGCRDVAQQAEAKTQGVKVPASRLRALREGASIMRGGPMPVAIGGVDIKVGEFFHLGQSVRQSAFQAGVKQAEGLLANLKPALAAQGGKKWLKSGVFGQCEAAS
jgi:hypothetical protein